MATRPLELQSLKWPFVGLAVALALCTGWAVIDEVVARRPWKKYQREFFALDEKHTREDLARAQKRLEVPATKKELDQARADLEAANRAMSGNAQERKAYDDAVKAEEDAQIKEAEAKLYLGFDKSEADATYYKLREARHEEHSKEEADLQKKLDDWNEKIKQKTALYEAAIQKHKEATAARVAFQARKDAAQAKIDAFEKPGADLKTRLETFKGLGKLPQMDQYWIEGLKNSWGSATVDRCQNCHMGVNKGGFSAPWEVLEAKKASVKPEDMKAQFALDAEVIDSYQQVHDKICEDLPPPSPAIPIGGAAASPAPAPMDPASATECRPAAAWKKWVEMAAAFCGPETGSRWLSKSKVVLKDAKGAVLPTGLSTDKKRGPRVQDVEEGGKHGAHDEEDAGVAQACTDKDTVAALEDAAKVDPYDVKPVFRTHPHRFELLVKTHPPEQFGCTTCHGGEGAQTKGVEHKAFRHGVDDHDWNDPLTDEVRVLGKKYKGAFMQAKCEKCHASDLTLAYAPTLSKGKKLFIDVGCWGCHPIEGYNDLAKRGPTLTSVASKTSPGWLHTWIQYPKAWRPATRMPNFWPGAVDASFVPHENGEKPEDVVKRHQKVRGEEVSAIGAYLWQTSEPAKLRPVPAGGDAARGKELFESVGCKACHVNEKGSEARRSEASADRDYAPNLWNIADKTNPEWIFTWIKNPKALWPETKMPDLRLSDAEGADLTAYLVTLKSDATYPAPPEYADKARLITLADQGKTLIAKYGCFGCHNIKGFENAQKIGVELTEEGKKDANLLDFGDVRYFTENPKHRQTWANFVWTKLHTPRIYAYERVETRMPQFDFSDDEALAIETFVRGQTSERPEQPSYLAGNGNPEKQAVQQGEKLVFWNGCRNCHIVEKRGGAVRDLFNEDNQSFAPPVLTGEGAKVQPEWLFAFLKGPYPLRPWLQIRMPTFHFSDEDATGVVHYFAASSQKSFPYLTATPPPMTPAQAHEATGLLAELKCLQCHVVGKLAPGQDPAAAAPNLLLAKSRLRPDWIPLWLKNPQALLDGTRMPSFWDFSDAQHPGAPSKAFGGDATEQIDALRDLLMHLGEPGFEPPKPARTASAAGPSHG
jgi:cytochrome c2/predicted  nucleic acid-binding Zn-ribbon protein